ncbi:Para-aminobenzoate synthase, partial [Globisporangium splendens]
MVAMLPPRSMSARVVTLLIDNYDSYTYNLYQMLAQVNGVAPVVFRNDDFGGDWHEAWLAFQDHVQHQFPKSEAESVVKVNLVISPGPGHPGTPSDFGMCADAIRCAQVPLFGVCLGHQGLAQVYGGKVVHAKEVMHGRTSRVYIEANKQKLHQQGEQSIASLFSHVPDGVEVVRYHSLVVDEQSLPSELVVTARTDDGVIMGLQHTTKPQFGVQFHPEAVCSAFGYQMLQNFRDLTLQQTPLPCHLQHSELQPHALERMTVDDGSTAKATAATMADLPNSEKEPEYKVRVHVASKGLASLAFAQQVFGDLYADAPRSFWLDSSNYDASSPAQQATSRFSLMGDNTGPLSACVEYCVLENLLRVYEADGETVLYRDTDILTHLRTQMTTFQAHKVEFHGNDDDATEASIDTEIPFAFRGGFVGYFGYEALGSGLEKHQQPKDPSAAAIADAITKRLEDGEHVPDASFLFADRTLVFDHRDGDVYSVSVSKSDATSDAATSQWHSLVAKQVRELAVDFVSQTSNSASATAATTNSASPVVFHPSRSREQYVRDIHEIQRLIRDGETYEVCLTNQLEASYAMKDPLGFYKVLRARNPAPYAGFYLSNPSGHFASSQSQSPPSAEQARGMAETYAICCSSPERFLRMGSDRWMESKPIKGTRRRGATAKEDTEIAMELAQCAKDRAENMMIADLVRNDFGIVAQIGSVHVPKLMAVETYATVHQLVTTVRGQRRVDADVVDVLKATFPGGSMTGAPKKRTMQIIRQLEQGPRGVYSGALGFLSLDGSCDLNIIIRTAVVTKQRVALGAGGAVIALSDTDDEYEEMLLKTRALVQAIGVFATGKDDGTGAKVEPW